MPKHLRSSAPKKARWTTAEKAARKKPHRGQPALRPSHGPAAGTQRPYADRARREDRGPERVAGRARREDRTSEPLGQRRAAGPPREDRPVRPSSGRPAAQSPRPERAARPAGDAGPVRGERPVRAARPVRPERPVRADRHPGAERAPHVGGRPLRDGAGRDGREERPRRGSQRDDRGNRPEHRSWDPPQRTGRDAEEERLEADAWTRSTRTPLSAGPVDVAADNGFAALGLPDRIVERLARDGITTPFPIQSATIPDALAGRDVLGRGQTGSGKTLAFGLPTLARLLANGPHSAPRRPRAIVLVPTRELAMQVSDALEPLVHVLGLKHKLVAGGLSYTTQVNVLNRGVDLLIATPGRMNDLLERGAVELGDIQVAILDEADHMADMGFLPEITTILDRIPPGGQRLLFSATLDKGVDTLVERYLTDAVTHSTDDAKASVTTMEHHLMLVDPMHKKVITAEVANREGRTLVFVRTKLGADRVAQQLREQGVLAAALHGGLNQGARNRVLGAFRDGTLPVLVATDVAARGIHVDDISVVLQVDPPADHKDYLHRSGRTARAGEQGKVVTLALPHQRRGMERQMREAGVDILPVRATPGDALLASTGATAPTGVPVPDEAFRRLLDGEPARRRASGGPRGPRHGSGSGARPPRGGRASGHGDRPRSPGRSPRS